MTQVESKADLEAAREKIRDNGMPVGAEKFVSPRWDISQERAFMENLLGQRASFLLVFFGLIIAGAINARSDHIMQVSILLLGCLICVCLALIIGRAQKKLDIILKIIKLDPSHPVTVVDDIANPSFSKRKLIGYVIPWVCVAALAVATLVSWNGGFATSDLPACSLQP